MRKWFVLYMHASMKFLPEDFIIIETQSDVPQPSIKAT